MTLGIITGYSHINLPANDMDKSIAFYRDTLGFTLLRKWSVNGRVASYVRFQDILLELTTPSRPTPADKDRTEIRMGFTVNDLDAALDAFRAADVTTAREPWNAQTF